MGSEVAYQTKTDYTRVLPGEVSSVSEARKYLCLALQSWGMPRRLVEDAESVIAELVSNAVNAMTYRSLCVLARWDQGDVWVGVYDRSNAMPTPRKPDMVGEDCETGRGLMMVRALADQDLVEKLSVGKIVWARFEILRHM